MLSRCYNRKDPDYPYYGGRGIKVHQSWLRSYADFLAYMGRKPTSRHSIDRFPDQNGDYEPGNVRWATQVQQQRNRRNNRLLSFKGETLTIAEWAERTGVLKTTIRERLERGWSVDDALSRPPKRMKSNATRKVWSKS